MIATRFLLRWSLLLCLAPAGLLQADPMVIPLWGGDSPPYSKSHDVKEYEAPCWFSACAYRVHEPTLTLFPQQGHGNGKLVLVIPGGGYDVVAIYHEGYHVAEALAKRGIAAAVLKYRLPSPETASRPELVPISDLRQAMRLLRERHAEWGIEAEQIGVLGFSAGAHLATVASVHPHEDARLNPDFSVLVYGVTRLNEENLEWLEKSLYHRSLSEQEIAWNTLLDHVDERTPPAFLVHALDDDTCHYSESTLYAEALNRHGVEAELHLYARGGHGFSLGRKDGGTGQWPDLAAAWIDRL